jgi:hypothetical protein
MSWSALQVKAAKAVDAVRAVRAAMGRVKQWWDE